MFTSSEQRKDPWYPRKYFDPIVGLGVECLWLVGLLLGLELLFAPLPIACATTPPRVTANVASQQQTHPLMPGIRATQLWDPNWPRTRHDRLATGFSPLVCNMVKAPVIGNTITLSGTLNWSSAVQCANGEMGLLIEDRHLRLISKDGKVLWSRSPAGQLCYQGDLRAGRRPCGCGRVDH